MTDTPEVAAAREWMGKHTAPELAAMAHAGREWTRAERAVLHGDSSPEFKERHIAANDELIARLDTGQKLSKTDARRARWIKRERANGVTYL